MQTFFRSSFKKAVLAVSLIILCLVSNLLAQEQNVPEDIFIEIACFKAKKSDAVEYFKTRGKAIHEEMIRQGILTNWEFYTVDYPNGKDCDCNFRAVRVFRGIGQLDKIKSVATRQAIIKKIWPDKNLNDLRREFSESIEFRHAEVYNLNDALIPAPTQSNMMVVNFMDVKPGERANYLKKETEIFKPLHAANNKAGKLVDWVVAERVLPYGTEFKADFITIDKFENYSDFFDFNFMDLFKKIHPQMDGPTTMKEMAETRKLLKSEVWQVVTRTETKPTETTSNK